MPPASSTAVSPRRDAARLPAPAERAGVAVLVVGLVALLAYAWQLGRDIGFFSDDWDIIAFHHDGHLLVPFNGHLSLLPIAVFRALFLTAGLGSYTPYRVVGFVSYVVFVVTLFVYGRARVGSLLAALAALAMAWFSAGDINVMFPFLMNFSLPLAAGAGIWIVRDRDVPWRDWIGGALLAIALASSGIGLTVTGAVFVELALRRERPTRWVPYLVPFALWLLWYSQYRTAVAPIGSIRSVIEYGAHELHETFAAFAGGTIVGGWVLLVAYAVVMVVAATRWHTFDARATGALAGGVSFIVLTSITRIGIVPAIPPETGRYLWVNGFFFVAALLHVLRGRRLPWSAYVIALVIVVVGAGVLVSNLRKYHDQVVAYGRSTRTYEVAVEAMPDRVDRTRIMPLSFIVVRAGDYVDAIRHLGSAIPHVTLDDLGVEADRHNADSWMVQDEAVAAGARPVSAPGPGPCTALDPHDGEAAAGTVVVVSAGGEPVGIELRRLARTFDGNAVVTVPAGATVALPLPADHGRFPWHVRADGATSVVRCP